MEKEATQAALREVPLETVRAHICIHVYICVHACVYDVCERGYTVCVCVHIYIYIYIYIYIPTYTHT